MEKIVRFTVVLRPHAAQLVDRYSERKDAGVPIDPTIDPTIDLSSIATASHRPRWTNAKFGQARSSALALTRADSTVYLWGKLVFKFALCPGIITTTAPKLSHRGCRRIWLRGQDLNL
jgi:hypothetical protein